MMKCPVLNTMDLKSSSPITAIITNSMSTPFPTTIILDRTEEMDVPKLLSPSWVIPSTRWGVLPRVCCPTCRPLRKALDNQWVKSYLYPNALSTLRLSRNAAVILSKWTLMIVASTYEFTGINFMWLDSKCVGPCRWSEEDFTRALRVLTFALFRCTCRVQPISRTVWSMLFLIISAVLDALEVGTKALSTALTRLRTDFALSLWHSHSAADLGLSTMLHDCLMHSTPFKVTP